MKPAFANSFIEQAFIVLAFVVMTGAVGTARAADPPPAAAANAPVANAPAPIAAAELRARLDRKDAELVVLDVRTPEEFAAGHVPGARNVPHDQIAARLGELAALKNKEIVLYCRSGKRAGLASQALKDAGFRHLRHLQGDFPGWEEASLPIER